MSSMFLYTYHVINDKTEDENSTHGGQKLRDLPAKEYSKYESSYLLSRGNHTVNKLKKMLEKENIGRP